MAYYETTGDMRDLDAKMAEILGRKLCYHELHETNPICKHCHLSKGFWWPKWGRIQPPAFYSTDARVAMIAADETGLFKTRCLWQRKNGRWVVSHQKGFFVMGFYVVEADTAALAICVAILKMKGVSI